MSIAIPVFHHFNCRKGTPWELAYVYSLMVTVETEHDAREAFDRWKDAMELIGLKVNMEKTKVMITGKHA